MPHSLSRLFCQLCVEFQLVVKVPEQEHKQHTVCDCDEHQATPLQYCTRAWNPQFMLPAFVNCCFNPVRSWCTDTNCVWMLLRVASKRVKSTSAAQPGAALNCTLEFFILTAWLHMYRQSIHLYSLPPNIYTYWMLNSNPGLAPLVCLRDSICLHRTRQQTTNCHETHF
jgi:hypothetical protein